MSTLLHLPCPCKSGKSYGNCCRVYHEGSTPPDALALMRSRYCAYAMHLADYIMRTSHPACPNYCTDQVKWKKEILYFSQNTVFEGLKILEFIDGEKIAYVTFTAILRQGGKDASFTEKSQFVKENGTWLYRNAEFKNTL